MWLKSAGLLKLWETLSIEIKNDSSWKKTFISNNGNETVE